MGAYDCDCINNLEYDRRERKQKEQPRSTAQSTARSTAQSTDLIDRQAAIDAAESAYVRNMFPTPLIREVPPVEPEPTDEQVAEYCKRRCLHIVTDDFFRAIQPKRAKGEWINTNPEYKNGFYNNSYYCSECHDYYTTSPYEMNYCPNCGADMRGEKDG